jgi:ribosome-binding factor A
VGHRLLKVNESVKEVVSAAIADGLKDPRVGFVTVTGVETSSDLRHAKVFFSVLGGEREREATLKGLQASHGYLQARVNAALHIKRTPQLVFVYDETTDKAMYIERLIRREAMILGERAPETPEPGTDQPEAAVPGADEPGASDDGGAGEIDGEEVEA